LDRGGTALVGDYAFFWMGCYMHKGFTSEIRKIKFVSDKISHIIFKESV
jgi:hypothetical protein